MSLKPFRIGFCCFKNTPQSEADLAVGQLNPWPDLVNKAACFQRKIEETMLRFKIYTFYNLLGRLIFSNQLKERFKDFITVVKKFQVLDPILFLKKSFK